MRRAGTNRDAVRLPAMHLAAIPLIALAMCASTPGSSPQSGWLVVYSVNHSYTEPGSESSEQTTVRAQSFGSLTLHYKHTWQNQRRIDSCTVAVTLDSGARARLATLCASAVASRPQRSYDGFEASDLTNLASFLVVSGAVSCTTRVSGIGARPPALDSLAAVLDSLSGAVLAGCPR